MLSRSLTLVPVARKILATNAPAITTYGHRLSHHGPPADYKYPTMDDMLVPCGSWQEHYDNMQRKYNIHLLLGSGLLAITLAVGVFSGALDLYIKPPAKPSPPLP